VRVGFHKGCDIWLESDTVFQYLLTFDNEENMKNTGKVLVLTTKSWKIWFVPHLKMIHF